MIALWSSSAFTPNRPKPPPTFVNSTKQTPREGVTQNSAPGLLARDTYGHGGWAGSEFWVTPSRGVCFVLLTNIGGGFGRFGVDADELHNAVAAAS